jgi:DNA (cytosine-5)-methyltransferase 1
MNHGSLFSGIGGFDLAAEWMGWTNVFHCEWEDFPRKVLNYHFPKSISYGDIKETDFTIHRGQIDILTGGFPCQPYSSAGKRLGKEDDRHLWPEMLRAITEIQPRWVVGENVRGLVNWNGGLVFEEVQSDLENQGYEVQPFILPAAGVNAPHRRDRVWFVATYTDSNGNQRQQNDSGTSKKMGQRRSDSPKIRNAWDIRGWQAFPTQCPICGGDDGISRELDSISFPKWRRESIKSYGNAIVPQVVYPIFKAIESYENEN